MDQKLTQAEKKAALKRLSLKDPVHFLALGFGSGLAPIMPGTFGSLAALPIVYSFLFLPLWGQIVIATVVSIVGIWICDKAAWDMKVHDHSGIVWDEIAGMLITFIAVPISLETLIIGFLLFRLFDIVKPWPISYLDKKVQGGLGIMADDVVAGILALISMHALLAFQLIPTL